MTPVGSSPRVCYSTLSSPVSRSTKLVRVSGGSRRRRYTGPPASRSLLFERLQLGFDPHQPPGREVDGVARRGGLKLALDFLQLRCPELQFVYGRNVDTASREPKMVGAAKGGDIIMPEFRVVCWEAGDWNQATARVIEAQDEQAAAERVCGGRLVARGKIGQLRAQVSPVSKPASKMLFYEPA
jgi:hypothetical protein